MSGNLKVATGCWPSTLEIGRGRRHPRGMASKDPRMVAEAHGEAAGQVLVAGGGHVGTGERCRPAKVGSQGFCPGHAAA